MLKKLELKVMMSATCNGSAKEYCIYVYRESEKETANK